MPIDPNPTARRRELASRLRQLRIDAGKSVDEAAQELMCSTAKISRMETAGRGALARDVRDLCRLYGVPDSVRDDLMEVAVEARKNGWWKDFRSLDERARTFVGLEDAAREVRTFNLVEVIGLLQTSAYTRCLLNGLRPAGELKPEWIDETIEVRHRRQQRLRSGELKVHAIIDEAALRRPLGIDSIMTDQIDRLLADAARPNVSLQLVPFSAGPYPGLEGPFQHMRFDANKIDDLVFIEGLQGNFILDRPTEVGRYLTIFDDISTRFALSPDATKAWLGAFRDEPRWFRRPEV